MRRGGLRLAAATAAASIVVIVVGLITDGPRVGGGFDEIEAASAPPRSEALGGYAPSAVLSSIAFEDGQTLGAGVARGGASTPFNAQTGPCALRLTEAGSLAIRILSAYWTGGLTIRYSARGCESASRTAVAGVRRRQGAYAGRQEGPVGSQRSSQGGGEGASEGGSHGAGNPVGTTIKKPVSGAGSSVGTAGAVGSTVKKPVSGVESSVGNAVNEVGDTVNSVGSMVESPAGGTGGIVKGLVSK